MTMVRFMLFQIQLSQHEYLTSLSNDNNFLYLSVSKIKDYLHNKKSHIIKKFIVENDYNTIR